MRGDFVRVERVSEFLFVFPPFFFNGGHATRRETTASTAMTELSPRADTFLASKGVLVTQANSTIPPEIWTRYREVIGMRREIDLLNRLQELKQQCDRIYPRTPTNLDGYLPLWLQLYCSLLLPRAGTAATAVGNADGHECEREGMGATENSLESSSMRTLLHLAADRGFVHVVREILNAATEYLSAHQEQKHWHCGRRQAAAGTAEEAEEGESNDMFSAIAAKAGLAAEGNSSTSAPSWKPWSLHGFLDARDYLGQTAVHIAAYRGHHVLLRLLLTHGASPWKLTLDGRAPVQLVDQLLRWRTRSPRRSGRLRSDEPSGTRLGDIAAGLSFNDEQSSEEGDDERPNKSSATASEEEEEAADDPLTTTMELQRMMLESFPPSFLSNAIAGKKKRKNLSPQRKTWPKPQQSGSARIGGRDHDDTPSFSVAETHQCLWESQTVVEAIQRQDIRTAIERSAHRSTRSGLYTSLALSVLADIPNLEAQAQVNIEENATGPDGTPLFTEGIGRRASTIAVRWLLAALCCDVWNVRAAEALIRALESAPPLPLAGAVPPQDKLSSLHTGRSRSGKNAHRSTHNHNDSLSPAMAACYLLPFHQWLAAEAKHWLLTESFAALACKTSSRTTALWKEAQQRKRELNQLRRSTAAGPSSRSTSHKTASNRQTPSATPAAQSLAADLTAMLPSAFDLTDFGALDKGGDVQQLAPGLAAVRVRLPQDGPSVSFSSTPRGNSHSNAADGRSPSDEPGTIWVALPYSVHNTEGEYSRRMDQYGEQSRTRPSLRELFEGQVANAFFGVVLNETVPGFLCEPGDLITFRPHPGSFALASNIESDAAISAAVAAGSSRSFVTVIHTASGSFAVPDDTAARRSPLDASSLLNPRRLGKGTSTAPRGLVSSESPILTKNVSFASETTAHAFTTNRHPAPQGSVVQQQQQMSTTASAAPTTNPLGADEQQPPPNAVKEYVRLWGVACDAEVDALKDFQWPCADFSELAINDTLRGRWSTLMRGKHGERLWVECLEGEELSSILNPGAVIGSSLPAKVCGDGTAPPSPSFSIGYAKVVFPPLYSHALHVGAVVLYDRLTLRFLGEVTTASSTARDSVHPEEGGDWSAAVQQWDQQQGTGTGSFAASENASPTGSPRLLGRISL